MVIFPTDKNIRYCFRVKNCLNAHYVITAAGLGDQTFELNIAITGIVVLE